MVQVNLCRKEVNCKIVYYGPGLSGKTTNLEMVHSKTPEGHRGDLTTIATEHDRTLFFDFMPIDLGNVAGMKTKLRLFTVPGQSYYNATRKLVLQGTDGIIFVADSQKSKLEENKQSFQNLKENLAVHKIDIATVPLVIQWNKRDMPGIMSVEELEHEINYLHKPTFEAVASKGIGVFPTLKKCAALVLESVNKKEEELSGKPSIPTIKGSETPDIGKQPGFRPVLITKKAPPPFARQPGFANNPKPEDPAGQAPIFKKLSKSITESSQTLE